MQTQKLWAAEQGRRSFLHGSPPTPAGSPTAFPGPFSTNQSMNTKIAKNHGDTEQRLVNELIGMQEWLGGLEVQAQDFSRAAKKLLVNVRHAKSTATRVLDEWQAAVNAEAEAHKETPAPEPIRGPLRQAVAAPAEEQKPLVEEDRNLELSDAEAQTLVDNLLKSLRDKVRRANARNDA